MSFPKHSVVAYANYYQCEPSMVINNIDVHSRMLLWCEAGTGEVVVNGNRFSFSKGRFLILPWRHNITYRADGRAPFKLGGVHLIPHYSPSLDFKAEVAHNEQQIWWKDNEIRDEKIPFLQEIISGRFSKGTQGLERLAAHAIERSLREKFRRQTAHSLSRLLFEEMEYSIKNISGALRAADSSKIEDLFGYIRENLHKEITLNKLCQVGSVSMSTLRRLFLKSTGVTPYEWILQVRMEKARYLLRTTSDSISHIAFHVGFEDPSYFVRLFRKREGSTPLQYRNQAFRI